MKPKRKWTIEEGAYATQRSMLNELRKVNATLDEILRIVSERFDPDYDESDDDDLI